MAETIGIHGHDGDLIEAYLARPLGAGPYPGVLVFHHAPGWDEWCMEATRGFAHHGYIAICPNLHHRAGPGSPDDMAVGVRERGGVPDEQCMGDGQGAVDYVRTMPAHNGKVGVIGFCSGGRQTFIAAAELQGIDAAVDCWGGRVAVPEEERGGRGQALDLTPKIHVPLLGIFGNDDANPAPDQVDRIEAELKAHNKTYEFHRYDGAGHGFFATGRPGYRALQAADGWKKVFAWFEKYLEPAQG